MESNKKIIIQVGITVVINLVSLGYLRVTSVMSKIQICPLLLIVH